MKSPAKRGTGGRKPPDDPEQSKRFEEAARELDTDVGEKAFKRAVDVVVPAKLVKKPVKPNAS